MVTAQEKITDAGGFDYYRMITTEFDNFDQRVQAFSSDKFAILNTPGSGSLRVDTYSALLGDAPEITLLGSKELPYSAGFDWQYADHDNAGFILTGATSGIYVGEVWSGESYLPAMVGITFGADGVATGFGTPVHLPYGYSHTIGPRANPANGAVYVHCGYPTGKSMDIRVMFISPSGVVQSQTDLGYMDSTGVDRSPDSAWYAEQPSVACGVIGGQEYLFLTYGVENTATKVECVIAALPITNNSVAAMSTAPTQLHLTEPTYSFWNPGGIHSIRTQLGVGVTEGRLYGELPSIVGPNSYTAKWVFSASFDGSTFSTLFKQLIHEDSTRGGEPYPGMVLIPNGTDWPVTFYTSVWDTSPSYRMWQWNDTNVSKEGGWGAGSPAGVTHTYGYWKNDWSYLGETGWAVVALNININGGNYANTLWLVNTYLVPPTVYNARSISGRAGGPRVVFE